MSAENKPLDRLGLEGKNAIVTGASRGIGESIARVLVGAGVRVIGVGRTFPTNWEAQFQDQNWISRFVGDVSDPSTADSALKTCIDKFGSIDILVNNAGIVISTNIDKLDLADWDKTMDINVKGSVHFCRAAAPEMIKRKKGGRIVNVSSVAAEFYESGLLAYTTTKGAINSFTRGLAIDLAPYNITVNAISPGWVNTTMGAGAMSTDQLKPVIERIPLRHIASTDEIADVVLFLCSNLSRYMTGQIVVVDGGETIEGTIKGVQY
jgi:3-oxoacyl-[acyl-carrier protein] reductase